MASFHFVLRSDNSWEPAPIPSVIISTGGSSLIKEKHISFRVTEEEYQIIKNKAKSAHMSVSRFVLLSAMDKQIMVVEGLKEFAGQLGKVGGNLNQAVVLLRQHGIQNIDIDNTKKVVNNIWQLLTSLTGRTNH